MKNITKRVFVVVFLAAIISLGCLWFILIQQSRVTSEYNTFVNGQIENRKLTSEISRRMYAAQARVISHVVCDDEEGMAQYEEEFQELDASIKESLREFEQRMNDPEEKEIFRSVIKKYNIFETQAQIALKFSRQGAQESAEYYVDEILKECVRDLSGLLDDYYAKVSVNVTKEETRLDERMQQIQLWRAMAFLFVWFVVVACLLIVYRSGRQIVDDQKRETDEHNAHVMDMQYKTIVGMANLIESRDGETGEHVKRTSTYAIMIAKALYEENIYTDEITKEYMDNLWKAAPLHDIGKIMVSDSILQKPGKLTAEEFDKMKLHATEGGNIIDGTLEAIEDEAYLDMAHKVAHYHHEKWDGSGYPEGLKGEEIPLCARIMAVADVFDALVSKRCYKEAMTVDAAYGIIKESRGSHFDPVIADIFIKIRPSIEEYLRNDDTDNEIRFK